MHWRGCPAKVDYLPVSVAWPSALHCNPCPTHCSRGNVPTPTPATLMDLPLSNVKQMHLKATNARILSMSTRRVAVQMKHSQLTGLKSHCALSIVYMGLVMLETPNPCL